MIRISWFGNNCPSLLDMQLYATFPQANNKIMSSSNFIHNQNRNTPAANVILCTVIVCSLAYAGFHATGVLRGAEWWNKIRVSPKSADFDCFCLRPKGRQGAHTPFAPPVFCICIFFSPPPPQFEWGNKVKISANQSFPQDDCLAPLPPPTPPICIIAQKMYFNYAATNFWK